MTSDLFSGTMPLLLFVAKSTVLLVAALVATMTLRRSTAGARHLVWLAALVGVLALPLLSRIPALKIGLLPSSVGQALVARLDATRLAPRGAAGGAAGGMPSTTPVLAPMAPAARSASSSGDAIAPAIAPVVVGDVAISNGRSGTSFFTMIAIAWAGVALSLLGWLIAGAIQVRRIVARARDLTAPDWTTPLCEVADRLDLETPPRLVISDRIEMAFACRAFAPTIVLPAAAEKWSDERRRAVLFHELSHVKRYDLVGHTLGRVACALYWFHPLVWTAARNLRNESERACDDLVLSSGARPSEYAQHLLDMVTSVRHHGAPVMALPMARKKEFEGRMLAILDPAIRRASPTRAQSASVAVTLGAFSLCVAAVVPAAARQPSSNEQRTTPRATRAVISDPTPSVAPRTTLSVAPAAQIAATASARLDTRRDTGRDTDRMDARIAAELRQGSTNDVLADAITTATRIGLDQARIALHQVGKPRQPQADTGRIAVLNKVLASDGDADVRRTAAWALHDVRTQGSKSALLHALQADTDAAVREMSAWALAEYESADVAAAIGESLVHDKSARVRTTCAWAIGTIRTSGQTDALVTAASDTSAEVREAAIWSLGQGDLRQAPPVLVSTLSDDAPRIRTVSAWTLGEIRDPSAARAIVRAFENETEHSARMAELHALVELGNVSSSVIEIAMKSSDPELRRRGVEMLSGNERPWPWPWPRPWPRPNP